jgi:hypothetical protein
MLENGVRISLAVKNFNPYFSNSACAPYLSLLENGRFLTCDGFAATPVGRRSRFYNNVWFLCETYSSHA